MYCVRQNVKILKNKLVRSYKDIDYNIINSPGCTPNDL